MLLKFKSVVIAIIAVVFMVTLVACNKPEVEVPVKPNLIKLSFEAEKGEYLSGETAKVIVNYDISDPDFEIKSFLINFQEVELKKENDEYYVNIKTGSNETKYFVKSADVEKDGEAYTIGALETEFEINVTNNETKIDVSIIETRVDEEIIRKDANVVYDNDVFFKEELEIIIKVQSSSEIKYDHIVYVLKNNLGNYYEGVQNELEYIGTNNDSGYPINEYKFMLESKNFSEENNEFQISALISKELEVVDKFEQNNGFSFEFRLREEELSKEFRFNFVKSDSEYIFVKDNKILNQRKTLTNSVKKEMNDLVMELYLDNLPSKHLDYVEVTVIKGGKTEKITMPKLNLNHTNRNGSDVVTFILKDDFSDGGDYKITNVSLGIVDERGDRKVLNPDKRFVEYSIERWDLLVKSGNDFEKLYLAQNVEKVLLLNDINIRGELNSDKYKYIKNFDGIFEGNGYSISDRGDMSLFENIGKNAIVRDFHYSSTFIPDYSASYSEELNSLYKTTFAVNNEGVIENIITEIYVPFNAGNRAKKINGFVQNNKGTIKNVEIRNAYKLNMHLSEINLIAENSTGIIENVVLNHTGLKGLRSTVETTYRHISKPNNRLDVYVIKKMENANTTKIENIIVNINLHAERSVHVDNFHAITSTLSSNTNVSINKVFITTRMERDYRAGITQAVKDFYSTYPEDTLYYEYFVERTKLSIGNGFVFEISNEFDNEELFEGGDTMYQNNGVIFDPAKWNFRIIAGLGGTFSLKLPDHRV